MSEPVLFSTDRPTVIAALHLPPSPAARRTESLPMKKIIDFALRNTEKAVKAGIPALYIQDLGDIPIAPQAQPHSVAFLSVVGATLRDAFPNLALGVGMLSHAAREPLAVAQAIQAQFVRIKVFTGAMVKAEGILQGCAYEAIRYRTEIGAENIAILADVHDRTGKPLGEMPLKEAAHFTAVHSRADALVLTGFSFAESLEMLEQVRIANLDVPLLLGGGADAKNISQALQYADGVIVSSSFKPVGGFTHEGMLTEWDYERIQQFMQAAMKK